MNVVTNLSILAHRGDDSTSSQNCGGALYATTNEIFGQKFGFYPRRFARSKSFLKTKNVHKYVYLQYALSDA